MLADAAASRNRERVCQMREGSCKSRIATRSIKVNHHGIVGYCAAHNTNVCQQSTLVPILDVLLGSLSALVLLPFLHSRVLASQRDDTQASAMKVQRGFKSLFSICPQGTRNFVIGQSHTEPS